MITRSPDIPFHASFCLGRSLPHHQSWVPIANRNGRGEITVRMYSHITTALNLKSK